MTQRTQPTQWDAAAWSALAGAVTFGSTLLVSQWVQYRYLGITTGTPPPTPSVAGMMAVGVASWLTHQTALCVRYICDCPRGTATTEATATSSMGVSAPATSIHRRMDPTYWTNAVHTTHGLWREWRQQEQIAALRHQRRCWRQSDDRILINSHLAIPWHTLRICAIGLLAYQLLGGRFWRIAPSSYTHVGAFARRSIPATERYATATERTIIEQLGRRFGCHTCGTKWASTYVGDHMPPRVVAERTTMALRKRPWLIRKLLPTPRSISFRFYPQCPTCSSTQGSILAHAVEDVHGVKRFAQHQLHKLKNNAHFHGWKMKPTHFGTGAVIAWTAVHPDVDEDDWKDGNRQRYYQWHQQFKKGIVDICKQLPQFK